METAKFEFEIKPIPSTRIMDTLKYWANITREKTGVFVDITMSNAHESFYEARLIFQVLPKELSALSLLLRPLNQSLYLVGICHLHSGQIM